jgi:hypothetical protein
MAKPATTKARYEVARAFDYVSAGRQYDVETRANSKHAHFRRTDDSAGCFVQMWQFKRAIADGSLVLAA